MSALTLGVCACGCGRHFLAREGEGQLYVVEHAPGYVAPLAVALRPAPPTNPRRQSNTWPLRRQAAPYAPLFQSRADRLRELQALLREWPRGEDWETRWMSAHREWRVAA